MSSLSAETLTSSKRKQNSLNSHYQDINLPVSSFAHTIIEQLSLLKSKANSFTCAFDPIFSDLTENLTQPVFSSLLTAVSFLDELCPWLLWPRTLSSFLSTSLAVPSQTLYTYIRYWSTQTLILSHLFSSASIFSLTNLIHARLL